MKAYLLLEVSITDLEGFLSYAEKIPAFIDRHGGRYVVRGEVPTVIEGQWDAERVVLIEFPDRRAAEAFLAAPDLQPLFKLRHETTKGTLLLVDGEG